MAEATGANARVTYVEETVWGTTPGSPSMRTLSAAIEGVALTRSIASLRSRALTGKRALAAVRGSEIDVSGALPFELPLLGIGTLLKHALGANTTTGSGPYTHVIKGADTLPAGLSLEVGYTDIAEYQVFAGCRVQQLDLAIPETGYVTGTLDVIGKNAAAFAQSSLGVPAEPAHDPFVAAEVSFAEGAVSAQLVTAQLTVNNNLTQRRGPGTNELISLEPGKRETTGQIVMLFEDDSLQDKLRGETESSLQFTFTSAAGSLTILLPKVKYFGPEGPGIPTELGITQTLEFTALENATEATDIQITLVNSEATI